MGSEYCIRCKWTPSRPISMNLDLRRLKRARNWFQPSLSFQKTSHINAVGFSILIILVASIIGVRGDSSSVPSPNTIALPSGDETDDVSQCHACSLVVKSFEKGIDRTSRGKHEGGDTSWEERNLKSYADSEVRLVEIQESLCEDVKSGKAQCLSLAEESESMIEDWWYNQRNKDVRLHDFLCITKLKRCCRGDTFGPNCQPCPKCNQNGSCDGSGTRTGTGKCVCEPGYTGDDCEECASDFFRVATNDHFTCLECDLSCRTCYGPGPTNCTECRQGYYKHEQQGCIDIDECESDTDNAEGLNHKPVCKDNTFCINTDGSYRCADCHIACSGCMGYGQDMCMTCAKGYVMDEDYFCRSQDESDQMDSWGRGAHYKGVKNAVARYFFYVGVVAVSVMMFRSNWYVMYTFTLGFIVFLISSELEYLDDPADNHPDVRPN